MDNRVFNVNGNGYEMLVNAIKLAFCQCGDKTTCSGWKFSKKRGLILTQYFIGEEHIKRGIFPFPSELNAEQCATIVWEWLHDKQASTVEMIEDYEQDLDHDGHNSVGWRVYYLGSCNFANSDYSDYVSEAICAIKPVFLWHGK